MEDSRITVGQEGKAVRRPGKGIQGSLLAHHEKPGDQGDEAAVRRHGPRATLPISRTTRRRTPRITAGRRTMTTLPARRRIADGRPAMEGTRGPSCRACLL